ncbi:uncharacterized protein L969DRAFT_555676 [Mixia osmundae IAM 14324]|uniref:uncharacterized protein n=1 Tax=Mixia osmundae (strain CBS 9802 / IAM 14324 / JCM 22182 / KY 12970) TaxID=764103 RepID=UPI0004A54B9E|nr:uncharacterized protein L969DRAFT_555676 [Mixia osmundae IAM 14324]KEI37910.1 hypothetical protein L969DRAFT_555676 [Mixia osmundae IAM 14324]
MHLSVVSFLLLLSNSIRCALVTDHEGDVRTVLYKLKATATFKCTGPGLTAIDGDLTQMMLSRNGADLRTKRLGYRNTQGFHFLPNGDAIDKREGTGYFRFYATNGAFEQGMWETEDPQWKRCCRAQAAFNVSLGVTSAYLSKRSTISGWIECGGAAASYRADCNATMSRIETCSPAFHSITEMPIYDIDIPTIQVYRFYYQASGQCQLRNLQPGKATMSRTTMGPFISTLMTISLLAPRTSTEFISFDPGRFFAVLKEVRNPGMQSVSMRFAVTIKIRGHAGQLASRSAAML